MNKTALITGASRGIGKACAEAFASAGYDLYLTCIRSKERLSSLKDNLEAVHGITCHTFVGDMGSRGDVGLLFQDIKRIDVIINNAGISYTGLLQDMSCEDWDNVMSTNLNSCFYTCRHAVPLMLSAGSGRILNVSSIWGVSGASMEVAYSASKGGVNAFTRALAKELAPSNIQVNAIACGVIDTDMNRGYSREDMDSLIGEIPADRMGTAEEAAELLLRLASAPAYLTGQVIVMDGGFL